MKKIILIALSVGLISIQANAKKEKTIKSTIKTVTVYTQGAQIQRKASYSINKGITTLIIEGISPNIDPNSLQLRATGDVVILDTKYSIFYPKPDPILNPINGIPPKIQSEIYALKDSLFELGYEIAAFQYKMDVLNSEKRIIENNGTIKGQGKVNDSIPLLVDAIKYYHQKMNEINAQLIVLTRSKSILNKEQTAMNLRLTQLKNYNQNNNFTQAKQKPPVHQIHVTVSSKASATGRIKVSYLVSNAGWIPMYDLRSSAAANKIDLTYKAHVYQNTGVSWENVKLNLSTNNPYANKTKPVLTPWYLDYYTYRNDKYNKNKKGYSSGAGSVPKLAVTENESMDMAEDDYDALTADNFTSMVKQLISVQYEIDLPYTIESDNEKNMVLINTKSLNTEFMYYAIPKLDLSVFMVARITNLSELNLIPGKANLFHEGSYLGNTWINPGTMEDTLDLSLGKDPNVIVKRTLIKNDSKQKIVGDKIVKSMAYKIEIKNHKGKSIRVIIQDQVPISRNEEIEVHITESSKGKVDEITGIVNWNSRLKASEKKTFDLIYTVKYGKTKNVNLAVN